MAWDIESLGAGGVSGFFIAILTAFGISRKVNKMEDFKQDKPVCMAIHKGIDEKINTIIEGQRKIWERLDCLNDYVRNNK